MLFHQFMYLPQTEFRMWFSLCPFHHQHLFLTSWLLQVSLALSLHELHISDFLWPFQSYYRAQPPADTFLIDTLETLFIMILKRRRIHSGLRLSVRGMRRLSTISVAYLLYNIYNKSTNTRWVITFTETLRHTYFRLNQSLNLGLLRFIDFFLHAMCYCCCCCCCSWWWWWRSQAVGLFTLGIPMPFL